MKAGYEAILQRSIELETTMNKVFNTNNKKKILEITKQINLLIILINNI